MWSVPREWPGEMVFVLGGGPSFNSIDKTLLKGRKVIAINSAWRSYPQADVLFFADSRWFRHYKPDFHGLMVTTSELDHPKVKRLRKVEPAALSEDPTCLALRRTSVTASINLAAHFGARKVILLGVDGKFIDGKRHNHDDQYPWAFIPGCFDEHAAEFARIAPSAERMGVEIINANPDSAITVWPRMTLEQADGLREPAL